MPSDPQIRQILAERIERLGGEKEGLGIVVGVIGPKGRRIIPYGRLGRNEPRAPDGDTGFEIGSVSKVFTALLLADMVRTGDVALSDPVTKYLPPSARVPERNGRSITLLDLATHTSDLPFMPGDLPALDDPNAGGYSAARFYDFLSQHTLSRDIGARWEYSNLGYWLLGEALASRAGTDYESLLRARILAPLDLKSTTFDVSPRQKANLAVGYDAVLQPAPAFASVPGHSLMPAAGGLVSTTSDLLTLLSYALGHERTPLAASLSAMLSTRRPAGGNQQALGWMVTGEGEDSLIVHDGGTFGYASALAWDPARRVGVVVLANQVTSVSDIARHLLRPKAPLQQPSTARRTEIAVEPSLLDKYVGRYEGPPDEGTFIIVRERHFLTIQPPADWGLPKLRLRPESPRDFFVAELPLRATFQTAENGTVTGLLVYPPRGQQAIQTKRTVE